MPDNPLLLPDDPNWKDPVTMGNPYEQGLTPKTAMTKRNAELDEMREKEGALFKYANSTISDSPEHWFVKMAQASGVSNMMTQPMWFSPLHTPQSWQVASKRREVYQWSRFFFANEPKVQAAIKFYCEFPMNGFKLECKNRKVLQYFEHHVVKNLKLNEIFKMISSEYFMLGDVFVHTDVKCPICHGIGINPETGERCNHPGGTFRSLKILNPDWMEVQQSILADEPAIVMIPDEELKRIVFYKRPENIYNNIPDAVKKLVLQGKPIPMSNRTISHLKHMPVPYGAYGQSLIRSLFTTLAYKTKIMTANWIVAERLIIPVRVIKIGSDERPATTADIADIQQQIAAVANDPNLTIVTHHNFSYDWYGACHDEKTEVLTDSGFKTYDQVDISKDKIMCYNIHTKTLKCIYASDKHVYDYDGEMICFNGKRLDICVTPNHKMLYSWGGDDELKTCRADSVKNSVRFVGTGKYNGSIRRSKCIYAKEDEFYVRIGNDDILLKDFCKFAGYYLSEGSLSAKKSNYHIHVYQSSNKYSFSDINDSVNSLGFHVTHGLGKSENDHQFVISKKDLVLFIQDNFGHLSYKKYIPSWMKQLPIEYLKELLIALINGDGHRTRNVNIESYLYTTTSTKLANDVQEIAFKCGYSTRLYSEEAHESAFGKRKIYRIKISKGKFSNGSNPIVRKHNISREYYKGKVWCFTVPTGFFVTRRNGKITIQGNSGKILQVTQEMEWIGKEILDGFMLNQSLLNGEMSGYQSAQVGVETLIRRIESWRHTLAEWCEERVFKPIAEMQGFIDEEKSEELGETVFLYPTIKWNDLNLKDKSQWYQLLNQLHDKQLISSQTLLEEYDINYDQEIKRMRYESAQAGPAGGMLGMGGMGMGGGGAPMGAGMDMGGGLGMGAPPGAEMGMGEAGVAPEMGGAGGVGGMGGMAEGSKVMKKGKMDKLKSEGEMLPPMMIKLTSIEQKVAEMLVDLANIYKMNPQRIRAQFPIQNPHGGPPYQMDFAIPEIKLDIESDGEIAHSSPEQISHDRERDQLLAKRGWTVLRFGDKVIEDAPQAVKQTIGEYMRKLMKSEKRASANEAQLFGLEKGKLINLQGNYDKYMKTIYISEHS